MELMDTSLDKFYRKVLEKNMKIPEDILGEIAVSVSDLALPSVCRTCCVTVLAEQLSPLRLSTSEAREQYLAEEAPGMGLLRLGCSLVPSP